MKLAVLDMLARSELLRLWPGIGRHENPGVLLKDPGVLLKDPGAL